MLKAWGAALPDGDGLGAVAQNSVPVGARVRSEGALTTCTPHRDGTIGLDDKPTDGPWRSRERTSSQRRLPRRKVSAKRFWRGQNPNKTEIR
jgi:hypothetical protein